MTCDLCAAIAAGLPITDDTPLPCRLRPTSHVPDPADPFHGAVFRMAKGETFPHAEALQAHVSSTTPSHRVEAHAPHFARARAHLESIGVRAGAPMPDLTPHPLDALKGQ